MAFVGTLSAALLTVCAVQFPLPTRARAAVRFDAVRDLAADGSLTFEDFLAAFNRHYHHGSEEYELRQRLYEERAKAVRAHNSQAGRRWTAAINSLSDLTDAEFEKRRGRKGSTSMYGSRTPVGSASLLQSKAHAFNLLLQAAATPLPNEVDWKHLGALKEKPDQGSCGSCWALAISAVLAGRHEIHMKSNRTFSAQELVSCTNNPNDCGGTGGCDGATMELGLDYAMKMGLATEEEMPYTQETGTCPQSAKMDIALTSDEPAQPASFLSRITNLLSGDTKAHNGGRAFGMMGWDKLEKNKMAPLMLAIQDGPVGVSVAAKDWSMYGGGVFDSCDKNAIIDHAVTLVGYGVDKGSGTKFWTIRNSWGPYWGEEGHIRLLRHETDTEHCGWNTDPKVGTACKPYPEKEWVCGMCGILFDSVAPKFGGPGPADTVFLQSRAVEFHK